ncbi:glycosyltransferase, partial [Prevotella sp.]|uniref:glycosyltransferase n=1 Tax=Prevotella sp. TaxID=59823 RepID=UPI0025E425CF
PNVVLEAQCFNRPVVSTTCVAVIKKIIQQGENGYYCDVEDADTLATCMIKAVNMKNIINNYNLFDKELLLKCFR